MTTYNLQDTQIHQLNNLLTTTSPSSLKFLILDEDTSTIISQVYTFTDLLNKDVFYTEKITSLTSEQTSNFRQDKELQDGLAIYFIRPSVTSIESLKASLPHPKYKNSEIIFSNVLPIGQLFELAKKDKTCSIKKFKVSFMDFYAIENHFFTFNIPHNQEIISTSGISLTNSFAKESMPSLKFSSLNPFFMRQIEGLISICCMFKLIPIFCYPKHSEFCEVFCYFITRYIKENKELQKIFSDYSKMNKNYIKLYIGARSDDPITPMITTWNYQSMANDLLNLKDGQLTTPSQKKVQFSCLHDEFFNNIKDLPFGDLAVVLQQKIEEFKGKRKKLETLKEMVEFIRDFPEFSKRQSDITKHVKICEILSDIVDKRNLITLSEIEQELVNGEIDKDKRVKVEGFIKEEKNDDWDKIKLMLIYVVLREKELFDVSGNFESLNEIKNMLLDNIELKNKITATSLLNNIIVKFGESKRNGNLIDGKGWLKTARRLLVGVKDVFTQYKPVHVRNFSDVLNNYNLKEFEFVDVDGRKVDKENVVEDDLSVFYILGGITCYEKAQIKILVGELGNKKNIIIGGSSVLNTRKFFDIIVK